MNVRGARQHENGRGLNDRAPVEALVEGRLLSSLHYLAMTRGSHINSRELLAHLFFRSRFALDFAVLTQGAINEDIEARPKLDISLSPVAATAAAFSVNIL